MRKLLLFVLLIVGCAREYECDVGSIDDDGEFYSIAGPGTDTQLQASTTLDWPDGEKEAKERCEAAYNDIDSTGTYFHCICEKAN